MARDLFDVEFALLVVATHRSWVQMRQRCNNPKSTAYEFYGGRGIKVCRRWEDFGKFIADMGVRPKGLSLDRIDFNKGYEPSNCKWATRKEQGLNRRSTRIIMIDGKPYFACELSKQSGIKTDTILERHAQGLSFPEIISPKKRVFHAGLAFGGMASGRVKQARTHCVNGHEFNETNTHINKYGHRICRMCKASRARDYFKQKRQIELEIIP